MLTKMLSAVSIFCVLVTGVSVSKADVFAEQPTWTAIGEARFSRLWFQIYDAALDNHSGIYEGLVPPLRLRIRYLRDIPRELLVEQTQNQWQRLALPEEQISTYTQVLNEIWPSVTKDDELIFSYLENGASSFEFNGKPLMSDHEMFASHSFAQSFLNIWLDPQGPYPDFYRALTNRGQ